MISDNLQEESETGETGDGTDTSTEARTGVGGLLSWLVAGGRSRGLVGGGTVDS